MLNSMEGERLKVHSTGLLALSIPDCMDTHMILSFYYQASREIGKPLQLSSPEDECKEDQRVIDGRERRELLWPFHVTHL